MKRPKFYGNLVNIGQLYPAYLMINQNRPIVTAEVVGKINY